MLQLARDAGFVYTTPMRKTINATEAARGFGVHLDDILRGDSFVITRRGKPIAKLVPCDQPGPASFHGAVVLAQDEASGYEEKMKAKIKAREEQHLEPGRVE